MAVQRYPRRHRRPALRCSGNPRRHCALRWLKLHLAQADREGLERAARVAKRIIETIEPPLGGPDAKVDSLYQAEVRPWGAEALIYMGREQEAELWLKEALELLLRTRANRPYRRWRRHRLIGRVHNDFGHMFWQSVRYRQAVKSYRAAIPHFRQANVRDE